MAAFSMTTHDFYNSAQWAQKRMGIEAIYWRPNTTKAALGHML